MSCLFNSHYYHYSQPGDKLYSLKRFFSRAKRQSAVEFAARNMISCQRIFPNKINLYDLASCIDNDDNHVTFVGHIVYLCPL